MAVNGSGSTGCSFRVLQVLVGKLESLCAADNDHGGGLDSAKHDAGRGIAELRAHLLVIAQALSQEV